MAEPVTLAEAKLNSRIDGAAEDSLVTALIVAAREHAEMATGLVLTRRQVVEARTCFGPWIDLRSWPIASIDSITYLDTAFVSQPLASEQWIAGFARRPVRIAARGNLWPRISAAPGAITITLTAGYATPAEVPQSIKQAILLLVAHWYETRVGVVAGDRAAALEVPLGVSALLRLHRVWSI